MEDRNNKSLLQTLAAFLAGLGLGRTMGRNRDGKKRHPIIWAVVIILLILIILPSNSKPKHTYSRITWPDNELAALIPTPNLKAGYISHDSETLLSIEIKASQKEFDAYVESCRECGFTVDYYRDSDSYWAYDEFGNYLRLSYKPKEKVMDIWLDKANDPKPEPEPEESEPDTSEPLLTNPTPGAGEAAIPFSSNDCWKLNYEEAVSQLQEAGFINVQTEPDADLLTGWLNDDGDVKRVSIGEETTFEEGDIFEKDVSIVVIYHTFPPKEDNSSEPVKEEILTIDNCEDLAAILQNPNEVDAAYSTFARNYKGQTIQFDGNLSAVQFHSAYNPITGETKTYDTIFDFLVNVGDFDADGMPGPTFRFEDVSAMKLPSIDVGENCTVTAKVGSYDSSAGFFEMSFVSMEKRTGTGELTQADIDRWIGKTPAN